VWAQIGGALVFSVIGALAAVVAIFPHSLGSIFTNDAEILEVFVDIRFALSAMMVYVLVSRPIRPALFLEMFDRVFADSVIDWVFVQDNECCRLS
jgi:Na+-driven multidrug efflux pump